MAFFKATVIIPFKKFSRQCKPQDPLQSHHAYLQDLVKFWLHLLEMLKDGEDSEHSRIVVSDDGFPGS